MFQPIYWCVAVSLSFYYRQTIISDFASIDRKCVRTFIRICCSIYAVLCTPMIAIEGFHSSEIICHQYYLLLLSHHRLVPFAGSFVIKLSTEISNIFIRMVDVHVMVNVHLIGFLEQFGSILMGLCVLFLCVWSMQKITQNVSDERNYIVKKIKSISFS